jgi:hypothetical protein
MKEVTSEVYLQRRYIASLLIAPIAESIGYSNLEALKIQLCNEGICQSGRVLVSCEDLDKLFDVVTLRREIVTNRLDEMGMFDERTSTWDTSKPILDIYTQHLYSVINSKRGKVSERPRFRVIITHDIDRTTFTEPTSIARGLLSSLTKKTWDVRVSPFYATKKLFKVFEWLLERERHYGICATYFVLSGPYGLSRYSSRYDIKWPASKEICNLIKSYDMTIGLHGNYYAREFNSYLEERKSVEDALEVHITQHRNHYLRFDPKFIWSNMEEAGFDTDFSIGFNYKLGFRAGTGSVYPGFDISKNRPTSVRAVPLLFMDGILSGLDRRLRLRELRSALEEVMHVGGCVAILFHPESFVTQPSMVDDFLEVIEMCISMGGDVSGSLPALPNYSKTEEIICGQNA